MECQNGKCRPGTLSPTSSPTLTPKEICYGRTGYCFYECQNIFESCTLDHNTCDDNLDNLFLNCGRDLSNCRPDL